MDIQGHGVDAQIFRQSIHICITIGVSTVGDYSLFFVDGRLGLRCRREVRDDRDDQGV